MRSNCRTQPSNERFVRFVIRRIFFILRRWCLWPSPSGSLKYMTSSSEEEDSSNHNCAVSVQNSLNRCKTWCKFASCESEGTRSTRLADFEIPRIVPSTVCLLLPVVVGWTHRMQMGRRRLSSLCPLVPHQLGSNQIWGPSQKTI